MRQRTQDMCDQPRLKPRQSWEENPHNSSSYRNFNSQIPRPRPLTKNLSKTKSQFFLEQLFFLLSQRWSNWQPYHRFTFFASFGLLLQAYNFRPTCDHWNFACVSWLGQIGEAPFLRLTLTFLLETSASKNALFMTFILASSRVVETLVKVTCVSGRTQKQG